MAIILDGNALAKRIRIHVKKRAILLPAPPELAVILVGNDPASQVYVDNKRKDCEKCGIISHVHHVDATLGEARLISLIHQLNTQSEISGILVQMPLPEGYNPQNVLHAISPEKDVDAFHPLTVGNFYLGSTPTFLPCTPAGVMELLDAYEIDPQGKHAVVVGASNIVGKPMATLLLARNATVTTCHIYTQNLASHTRNADILVVAVGKVNLITADMVKPSAVVIDIGINREGDTLRGDVDFEAVKKIASHITPVPGGVGPMTRAMLMRNTLNAALGRSRD
ncbi:MAG: bifunctional 5,10-methylenetetrahydrofolate dehydrogenase/5,10-methenyltetrahydrofolate cyclohydrolase [Defluviitaleaceae bacterium]|nr:bifunctional 5,10-methylenetetrahydrofolate dehydrogenase/5,10-methenyltetrahydrofolate cyclohydrolase [Defluviitaleaceae bacterium]MCL2261970.1 bifunctional 5,10-methylenetetrahydrofolate dehydrogenase/5,10-methenyltetrahydrofolate cyclohydrolase [Defluviitaleaceae bacterium]